MQHKSFPFITVLYEMHWNGAMDPICYSVTRAVVHSFTLKPFKSNT